MTVASRVQVRNGHIEPLTTAGPADPSAALVWTALVDPVAGEVMTAVAELDLPEALAQDLIREHRRPRVIEDGRARAVVLLPALYDDPAEEVLVGGLTLLVGERSLLTVSRGPAPDLDAIARQLGPDSTPGEVLHSVFAHVVTDYDRVVDGLDDDVDQVETQVFSDDRKSHAQRIYRLKRESLELKRAVAPLVGVAERLECGHTLRDRLARVAEHVDRLDDLLNSILDADLAQVSVRQNEDQRRISAWAAVALVPTVVGAIYGMNFQHMPELSLRFGYPSALALIAGVCSALYVGFRRNGWL